MLLLTGCASDLKRPVLSDPPIAVVDALETVARQDANAAAWVIGLDRFYRQQDLIIRQ